MSRSLLKKLTNQRLGALLLLTLLTATTAADAQTQSTINVCGTDYTLFTGFTATDGNGTNYAKLVDGNTSTDWIATKNYDDPNAPANDFAGGTADPAFVEFHADAPFIPKGYVLTCDHENAGFWKPYSWALKARLNESDGWTTIHSSTTTLGAGKTFEIACTNDGNNQYQYFRLEVYEVGSTTIVDLDELQIYGSLPAYTHLTVKAATCMATGIKQECYRRNSDGKYFTDETGTTELAESDVIAPMIPHSGEHHDATDVNIEYWQCSMCGKYFSDSGYTTEITEEQTKIYRTITIDSSISGLVEVAFSKTQALAGESIILYVDYQVDASTLKVNDGAVELTAKTDIQYTFTMPAADVTVTADVAQSNADGDVLTGSIRHTVTIPDGASITLNNATITGSIVCEGSATITLVGTNSVSGATNKAGIQIGGSGTTLTINGDGTLTANGGDNSAGIGLSRAWNVTEDVVGGNIVINGGNITANGGGGGAGIGAGVTKDPNNSSSRKAIVGTITIAGGSVTAVGGSNADGIGAGENNYRATILIGTVTIYDGIDKVEASSIKDFGSVVYKRGETDVTASKTDYFTIAEDGNRRLIVQKLVIAEIADQSYTGSAITPEPKVTMGSRNLTNGTDYTYSYTNNTNAGTATVKVTFLGKYALLGYVEKTFSICRNIYIADVIAHGKVSADSYLVDKDKIVTLTVTPDEGYIINTVSYNDGTEDHTITPSNNVYSFTMPASDVTVSATFAMIIASVTVGETEAFYASVDAAVAAAKAAYVAAQGETAAVVPVLKLYDDINYGANSLQIGNGTNAFEMTLDLNGHRFYGKGAQVGNIISNLIYIAPKAKLTVVDTSNGDTKGSIDCTETYGQCIINCGTLNLNGGIVKYSGKQGIVVCNYDGGLLTLDGATINGKPTSGNNSTGILNAYGSTCNIVSGSIEDCNFAIQNNKGDVNMSDGVITNCRYGIDLNHSEANTLIISGGTISNCSEEGIKLGDKGNLNMTAFPVFSDNTTDIKIRDQKKIIFGAGTYTAPTSPITVKVDYSGTDPYVFTEGYSAYLKDVDNAFNVAVYNGDNVNNQASVYFFNEGVIAAPKTFSFAESQVWSTWCDQYEWTKPEGIEVYDVTGVSNSNVSIQQLSATAIPAYKPVLLKKKDSGSLEATIAGVGTAPESYDSSVGVVTTTVGDATLVGTIQEAYPYSYFTYNKTYILYNNEFMLIYSNDGLAAHKFWINMDIDGADKNKKCSRSLSIGGDGTTSLREVNSGEVNSEEWYSLDGRKLGGKPTKKGLYINNGKKMVIK